MFLVLILFQFHSLWIQSISWYDFGVPIFFPIITIQWDHRQASRSFSWFAFKIAEVFYYIYSRIKRRFMLRMQRELNSSKQQAETWNLLPAGAIYDQHSCPRSATAVHLVAVYRTPNLPIERRTIYHWASAAPMVGCFLVMCVEHLISMILRWPGFSSWNLKKEFLFFSRPRYASHFWQKVCGVLLHWGILHHPRFSW